MFFYFVIINYITGFQANNSQYPNEYDVHLKVYTLVIGRVMYSRTSQSFACHIPVRVFIKVLISLFCEHQKSPLVNTQSLELHIRIDKAGVVQRINFMRGWLHLTVKNVHLA